MVCVCVARKSKIKWKKVNEFSTFSCHKPDIIQQTPTEAKESPSKTGKKKRGLPSWFVTLYRIFWKHPDRKSKQKLVVRGVDKFNFIFQENIIESKALENILNLFNFKH